MQYRNELTGALIETECAVSGEHWRPAEASVSTKRRGKGKSKDTEPNMTPTPDSETPEDKGE